MSDAKIIANSAHYEWTAAGEGKYANWFKKTYGVEGFENFSLPHTKPGCGTDNNSHERFNGVIKQQFHDPVGFPCFVSTSLPLLFSNISLHFSGKMNGSVNTLGGKNNISQIDFIRKGMLSRDIVLDARKLIDNKNMIHFNRAPRVHKGEEYVGWYSCNTTRNLFDSPPINNDKYIENATRFVKNLRKQNMLPTEYYATVDIARTELSNFHLVKISKIENSPWKMHCTCYVFNRNAVYCPHILGATDKLKTELGAIRYKMNTDCEGVVPYVHSHVRSVP